MKKTISVLGFLILLIFIPYQINGQDKKYIIGFSYGYSFGLTNEYKKNESLYPAILHKAVYQYKLGSYFGVNLQYYFSSHWGIQGEIVYQRKIYHRWELGNPEYISDESYIMPFLNVIYKYNIKNKLSPYFSIGIGMRAIQGLQIFSIVSKVKLKGGIKYKLFSSASLNLGISFYTNDYSLFYALPEEINYLNLNICLEYKF
jgi:opacity protein-like surface antigen